jgi:hypothetical protein
MARNILNSAKSVGDLTGSEGVITVLKRIWNGYALIERELN